MNVHPNPKRCRGEAGLTLQEMLIAMVISAIIAVPIGGALFTSLHTTNSTINRTRETVDANLLSTWFGTDVQNAVQVSWPATEPTTICGPSATTQTGLLLTTSLAKSVIFYYRGAGANSVNLYRQTCAVDASNNPTPGPALVLVRHLASVAYACLPDCTPTAWRSVSVTITQTDSQNPGSFGTTVQASRRVS